MSFWSDPIGSISNSISAAVQSVSDFIAAPAPFISQTVSHASDVLAKDDLAKAGAVAAAVYFSGGAAGTFAGTTAGEYATAAGADLLPVQAVNVGSWGGVASVEAGALSEVVPTAVGSFGSVANVTASTGAGIWETAKAIGSAGVDALGTAGKIAGGLNVVRSVSSKPNLLGATPARSVSSIIPYYGAAAYAPIPQATTPEGGATAAAGAAAVSTEKPKDSTLTVVASSLTILAILYQFSKG